MAQRIITSICTAQGHGRGNRNRRAGRGLRKGSGCVVRQIHHIRTNLSEQSRTGDRGVSCTVILLVGRNRTTHGQRRRRDVGGHDRLSQGVISNIRSGDRITRHGYGLASSGTLNNKGCRTRSIVQHHILTTHHPVQNTSADRSRCVSIILFIRNDRSGYSENLSCDIPAQRGLKHGVIILVGTQQTEACRHHNIRANCG